VIAFDQPAATLDAVQFAEIYADVTGMAGMR
jgi:hypothetical protein